MGINQPERGEQEAHRRLIGFGRAVSDPTRVSILGALAATAGLTVADLTERLGLHHSAIRAHLQTLAAAGLIRQHNRPAVGRGRPAKVFRVAPGALERWGVGGPHRDLAEMLVDMVSTGDDAATAGRRAGRRMAAAYCHADELGQVEAVTRRLGFEPSVPVRAGARVSVRLAACPFAASAETAPQLVCGLHRGVVEGVVDGGERLRLDELRVADPSRGGCELVFTEHVEAP